jgi:hypothetical protein
MTFSVFSQDVKKEVSPLKISAEMVIDGYLSEEQWYQTPIAHDFVQFSPYNGAIPTQLSEVRILYDDEALYIAAVMFDSAPDSIYRELGLRDAADLIADFFTADICPYNDGLNACEFKVYASGVQSDTKYYGDESDVNWDAVWESKVIIDDQGWQIEMKIPYSALRFPRMEKQHWSINFWRHIRRNREFSTWNFVDIKNDNSFMQMGVIEKLENISPPLRLSFEPYLSSYLEKTPDAARWKFDFNYGLDLKYGISQSFTLDMTLIPDFGQTESDDKIVNLTPFETYYEEKRQFFTEGIELFSRGDVFYSRRIGGLPWDYEEITGNYADSNIIDNPENTRILNATKVSGRTAKGLGLGVFNAITGNTYATVLVPEGSKQEILTQPVTNYNMLVIDQSLWNNSFISLYNTNVYGGSGHYTANVSGAEFLLADRKNIFASSGLLNVTQKYFPDSAAEIGFKYNLSMGKASGNFRFSVWEDTENDTYDPNDMGFDERNNSFDNGITLEYDIYDPFWKILDMRNELEIIYESLFQPLTLTEFNFLYENRTTFKNHAEAGLETYVRPVKAYDYYEPRNEGWKVMTPPGFEISAHYTPDYTRKFVVDLGLDYLCYSKYDQNGYGFGIQPRLRASNHLFMAYSLHYMMHINDMGYVTDSTADSGNLDIVFGARDVQNVINTLNVSYTFNNRAGISFRLRHYFFKVNYNQFYDLEKSGDLVPADYTGNADFNYNAFNIDMYFTWNFAPGSEMVVAWKNSIYTEENEAVNNYFKGLEQTMGSPATNSFSIKFLYHLDYQTIQKTFGRITNHKI